MEMVGPSLGQIMATTMGAFIWRVDCTLDHNKMAD